MSVPSSASLSLSGQTGVWNRLIDEVIVMQLRLMIAILQIKTPTNITSW
jgi:hypothetical protein